MAAAPGPPTRRVHCSLIPHPHLRAARLSIDSTRSIGRRADSRLRWPWWWCDNPRRCVGIGHAACRPQSAGQGRRRPQICNTHASARKIIGTGDLPHTVGRSYSRPVVPPWMIFLITRTTTAAAPPHRPLLRLVYPRPAAVSAGRAPAVHHPMARFPLARPVVGMLHLHRARRLAAAAGSSLASPRHPAPASVP